MSKLTVITGAITREITFVAGTSVREVLEQADVPIRSGCRGNGACGLCLVQVEAGETNELSRGERLVLTPEQIEQNTRLACQLTSANDLCVRMIGAPPPKYWRDLDDDTLACTPPHVPPAEGVTASQNSYGLAVDLGTTHISLSLWDLTHGNRLSGSIGPNPQSAYGSDVMSRLIAAGESAENVDDLARMACEGIRQGLLRVCSRQGIDVDQVVRIVLVGNTAMLALATGVDARLTWPLDISLHFSGVPRPADQSPRVSVLDANPKATVEVVPPLEGFVGSDLLAGVLATRLTERPGALLIDFGTNSEIALWDGQRLWATSAAGGPAFEGWHMPCGMPAEPGAIYRVERQRDDLTLHCEAIGNGEAKGLCGSGLVDLIACLRQTDDLTAAGRLAARHAEKGYAIGLGKTELRLSNRDIDMFQRAKAAIAVGIRTLLTNAGMKAGALAKVCVSGTFGRHLNVRNAQAIGLLPNLPAARIELCGNTALAGCERILTGSTAAADLARLRRQATVINLAKTHDFEQLFMECLYLRPMEADGHE